MNMIKQWRDNEFKREKWYDLNRWRHGFPNTDLSLLSIEMMGKKLDQNGAPCIEALNKQKLPTSYAVYSECGMHSMNGNSV